MPDAPDASLIEQMRREAFEETGRMAFMAEEFAQKLFDETERRDLMGVGVRLQQLRFCTMAMIQTFNHFLRTQPHGQGMAAAEAGPSDAHREDQRSGDVVA
jgi:hypothetical protein